MQRTNICSNLYRHLSKTLLVLGLSGCVGPNEAPPTIAQAIADTGFTQLQPPSKLFSPGAVLAVTTSDPFQGRIVCGQTGALGEDITLAESATLTSEWQRKVSGGINLDLTFLQKLSAQVDAKGVKTINLALTNTQILEVADEVVVTSALAGNATAGCRGAIKGRLSEPGTLTMIRSVIQADVEYTVVYDDSLSSAAKSTLSEKLAASISADLSVSGDNKLQAKGLYFGIIDDSVLLHSFLSNTPELNPGLQAAPANPRTIPAGAALRIQ